MALVSVLFMERQQPTEARRQDTPEDVDSELALQASVAIVTQFDQAEFDRQQVAGELVDVEKQKAAVRARLQETFKARGQPISDEQVTAAVDSYFAQQWEFEGPTPGLEYKLARMYVNRGWWGKTCATVGIVAGLATGTVYGLHNLNESSKRSSVEQRISAVYTAQESGKKKIAALRNEAADAQLPPAEAKQFESRLQEAEADFAKATRLIGPYVSEKGISVGDYNAVDKSGVLAQADGAVTVATADLNVAQGIVGYDKALKQDRVNLDDLVAQIRRTRPPAQLLQQAEQHYTDAVAALNRREGSEAAVYEGKLRVLNGTIEEVTQLPIKVEQAYTSIKSVAKDSDALKQADGLYTQAQSARDTANVNRLKETLAGLQTLDTTLNQAYTLTITGGKWRHPHGNDAVKTFYILLEAKDANGRSLPRAVKNEENGSVETVTVWGERVPESVYERVKSDKEHNGRITNNVFGAKEKGYLNENITFQGPSGPIQKQGQITKW